MIEFKKTVEQRINNTIQIDFIDDEIMVIWSDDPEGSYDPIPEKMATADELWSALISNAHDSVRGLFHSYEWENRFFELLKAMDPPKEFDNLLNEMNEKLYVGVSKWHKVKPEDFEKYVKKQKYPKKIQKMLLSLEVKIPKIIEDMKILAQKKERWAN